ncbi:MAG: DUF4912 domain-containing protein [Vulcanococcus sp.]
MTQSQRPFDWLRKLNPFSGNPAPASQANEVASTGSSETFTASQASSAGTPATPAPVTHTEVVFLPRDPQWAYCFWSIAPADRQRAQAAGAGSLCLRVADVTGLLNPSAQPHALQELVVDAHASEWFLPVPLAGRDYRVELGYRLPGGGWFSLAFSAVARIPELEPSATIADAFVPFSLETPVMATAQPISAGGVQHERLYQMATVSSPRLRRVGSEALHEDTFGLERGLNDSGAGLWASGRSDSGSGLVRSRSFWLVADAELIVYGATEPTATLTIGEQVVPLDQDGGFRVHVPFPDGQQTYAIKAVAADGEQERSITLDFERSTPEARVNTKEQAVQEWF